MKNIFKLILSAFFLTIVLSVFASASSTDTILTRSNEKIKCSVYFENIPEGSVIVLTHLKTEDAAYRSLKPFLTRNRKPFLLTAEQKK